MTVFNMTLERKILLIFFPQCQKKLVKRGTFATLALLAITVELYLTVSYCIVQNVKKCRTRYKPNRTRLYVCLFRINSRTAGPSFKILSLSNSLVH
jgi:hypothetical protein